jgi:uncharacterized membrane protein
VPEPATRDRSPALGVLLIIAGALGLFAAFELTIEKFLVLTDPSHVPSCNVGVLVGCSTNLESWQGSVFGFPNPLVGVVAWPAVIVVGFALLAGARFARWFWLLFNLGVAGAFVFVGWLIYQSIYVLDVLCPWCMLTWLVTIPVFWAVTLANLRDGRFSGSARARRFGAAALGWVPLITVVCCVVIVVLAQLQMNAIPRVLIDLQSGLS